MLGGNQWQRVQPPKLDRPAPRCVGHLISRPATCACHILDSMFLHCQGHLSHHTEPPHVRTHARVLRSTCSAFIWSGTVALLFTTPCGCSRSCVQAANPTSRCCVAKTARWTSTTNTAAAAAQSASWPASCLGRLWRSCCARCSPRHSTPCRALPLGLLQEPTTSI